MSQGCASFLSQGSKAYISVRMVTVDYYLSSPVSGVDPTFADGRAVLRVPVLRIFGPTAAGQKACVHLHGVFPYLYVPVPDPCPESFATKLAAGLDRALSAGVPGGHAGQQRYVHRVAEVSGVPYYGYHPKKHKFLKVYFNNPMMVKKAADILLNRGVLGMSLQPHESHIPYVLQFMMDYNLQGMNFIHLAATKFRKRLESDEELMHRLQKEETDGTLQASLSQSVWLDAGKLAPPAERTFKPDELPETLLMPDSAPRTSSTELELDAVAADILNTNDVGSSADIGKGTNPGIEAIWEDERERRRLLGMDEPLDAPASPPRPARSPTESHMFWKERLLEKLEAFKAANPTSFKSESASTDPEATCNMGNTKDVESDVSTYPAEDAGDKYLLDATEVETHVEALSATLFGASRGSINVKQSLDFSEEAPSSPDMFEDTLTDEDVLVTVNDSLSRAAAKEADVAETDDLVELLVELGNASIDNAGQKEDEGSHRASLRKVLSQMSKASRERQEAEELETLEMSQIWRSESDGSDNEEQERGEKEKNSRPESAGRPTTNEDIWGGEEDDDEEFWKNLTFRNIS